MPSARSSCVFEAIVLRLRIGNPSRPCRAPHRRSLKLRAFTKRPTLVGQFFLGKAAEPAFHHVQIFAAKTRTRNGAVISEAKSSAFRTSRAKRLQLGLKFCDPSFKSVHSHFCALAVNPFHSDRSSFDRPHWRAPIRREPSARGSDSWNRPAKSGARPWSSA